MLSCRKSSKSANGLQFRADPRVHPTHRGPHWLSSVLPGFFNFQGVVRVGVIIEATTWQFTVMSDVPR